MILHLLFLLLCLLGSAFAAGVETGIISMNRLRLQHQLRRRVPGARTVRWFLERPDILLSTTLLATNLLHVAAAVAAAHLGHALAGVPGATVAGLLLTLVILVACEYIPKAWFQASPSSRVLPFAPLLRAFAFALAPLVWLLHATLRLLSRQPASSDTAAKLLVSREELLYLAREGVQSGVLTPHETQMIHGVVDLTHKTCASLMTPLDRVASVPASATVDDFLSVARKTAYSRFPVYDAAKKTFVGVVNLFDVLADASPAGKTVAAYARPLQLVAS